MRCPEKVLKTRWSEGGAGLRVACSWLGRVYRMRRSARDQTCGSCGESAFRWREHQSLTTLILPARKALPRDQRAVIDRLSTGSGRERGAEAGQIRCAAPVGRDGESWQTVSGEVHPAGALEDTAVWQRNPFDDAVRV